MIGSNKNIPHTSKIEPNKNDGIKLVSVSFFKKRQIINTITVIGSTDFTEFLNFSIITFFMFASITIRQ